MLIKEGVHFNDTNGRVQPSSVHQWASTVKRKRDNDDQGSGSSNSGSAKQSKRAHRASDDQHQLLRDNILNLLKQRANGKTA